MTRCLSERGPGLLERGGYKKALLGPKCYSYFVFPNPYLDLINTMYIMHFFGLKKKKTTTKQPYLMILD